MFFCCTNTNCQNNKAREPLSALSAWSFVQLTPNNTAVMKGFGQTILRLSCSCIYHERWRLSHLRFAADVAVSQAAIGLLLKTDNHTCGSNVVLVVVVGCWWLLLVVGGCCWLLVVVGCLLLVVCFAFTFAFAFCFDTWRGGARAKYHQTTELTTLTSAVFRCRDYKPPLLLARARPHRH